ncbi:MAG TPA: hypothetical protein VMX13_05935 [Sedimentisphaerales bacterium]|nr:hypothetical protein [Sedimentisphaerales bacterium]
MNWEKGLKRLAMVLAVVVGIVHCGLVITLGGSWVDRLFQLMGLQNLGSPASDWAGLFIAFLIGFLPVWGIPSAVFWAIKGFKEGQEKRLGQPPRGVIGPYGH